jgi:hypothetical protein
MVSFVLQPPGVPPNFFFNLCVASSKRLRTSALDKQTVIYGLQNKNALNTLLTLIKRTLILQQGGKQAQTCEDIKRKIK